MVTQTPAAIMSHDMILSGTASDSHWHSVALRLRVAATRPGKDSDSDRRGCNAYYGHGLDERRGRAGMPASRGLRLRLPALAGK